MSRTLALGKLPDRVDRSLSENLGRVASRILFLLICSWSQHKVYCCSGSQQRVRHPCRCREKEDRQGCLSHAKKGGQKILPAFA